jgi:hypothetical protein
VRSSDTVNAGVSPPTTAQATVTPTASQVTGRQRDDSDRPVGNNNSGNTTVSIPIGSQIQVNTQAATSRPGSDPGCVT